MQVRTVRKPGEPGTQQLMSKYGARLVSVRYRYDAAKGKRYKTVELIIAEEDWRPDQSPSSPAREHATPTTPMAAVRIQYDEKDLQRQIKAIGGSWDARKKLWYAPEKHVERVGLANRIVRE